MNVLIIEDESFAAKKLIAFLKKYDGGMRILEQIDTVEDAVDWFCKNDQPDLIFMDIHLADGNSFEIFEHVLIESPIVFTTAYDQYAIRAFKMNSVDYLLKPLRYDDLKAALYKYDRIFNRQSSLDQVDFKMLKKMISTGKQYKSRFLVKAGNLIKTVTLSDVAYFYFEDRTTLLVTNEGRRYPIRQTLMNDHQLMSCFIRFSGSESINSLRNAFISTDWTCSSFF